MQFRTVNIASQLGIGPRKISTDRQRRRARRPCHRRLRRSREFPPARVGRL